MISLQQSVLGYDNFHVVRTLSSPYTLVRDGYAWSETTVVSAKAWALKANLVSRPNKECSQHQLASGPPSPRTTHFALCPYCSVCHCATFLSLAGLLNTVTLPQSDGSSTSSQPLARNSFKARSSRKFLPHSPTLPHAPPCLCLTLNVYCSD